MSKLELLQCKTCGGHIDRDTLTCNSCGAMYRLNEDFMPVRLEVSHLHIDTLVGKTIVPSEAMYLLGTEKACEMTLKEMAERMAEKILPYIEYQMEFDPRLNQYITHGRLRVANPNKWSRDPRGF